MKAHASRRGVLAGLAAVGMVVAMQPVLAGAAPEPAGQADPGGPDVVTTELPPIDGAGPESTVVHDVNDQGQAVGRSGDRAVMWQGGQAVVLPEPKGDGYVYSAQHVNDRGQVVVRYQGPPRQAGEGPDVGHYLWSDGQVMEMPQVNAVDDFNDDGQALARVREGPPVGPGGPWHFALWDDGTAAPITPPDDLVLRPEDLGEGGHVVGRLVTPGWFFDIPIENDHGSFVWRDGTLTRLDGKGVARAVNRSGQVIGDRRLLGELGGTLWTGTSATGLGNGFHPYDVNDQGQVAGGQAVGGAGAGTDQAAVWDDGRVTRLGTAGSTHSYALRINEAGVATGRGRMSDGEYHAVLWVGGEGVDLGLGEVAALSDTRYAVGMISDEPDATPRALLWEVEGAGAGGPGEPGDPGDPPDEQCVAATNAAHVQAGRATSFLLFAWAVGSDQYLGLTSATTALRETSPGRWELVESC